MRALGTTARRLVPWALLGAGGCYTAELDPDLTGVFACTAGDEASCPTGQTCVNRRCEDAEALPSLTILNPEEGFKDVTRAPDEGPVPMDVGPVTMTVTFQGSNLSLVPASSSGHMFGEGHVAVFVDGSEVTTVQTGSISDRNTLMLEIPPTPGAHRIAIQARRNDGLDYDNAGALATRLIWLENDLTAGTRPFVAIRSPWPGQTFGLDAQSLEVQVMAINFDLVSTESGPQQERSGHAHIYYDADFPPCAADEVCDQGYLGTAKAPQEGEVFSRGTILLPGSSAGETTATLTAVLRNYDHTIYRFPFGCTGGPLCFIAFEDIEILRVSD